MDLASPPVLTDLTERLVFFSSGHPFSLYLNRLYRPFPILDLSGGNVTHAAASLAQAAGAREVYLYGADFSYPSGQPYARGTYLFPYFQSRSVRMTGSENNFYQFIRDSRPRRESVGDTWRFRTSTMDHYRESLEIAVDSMNFNLIRFVVIITSRLSMFSYKATFPIWAILLIKLINKSPSFRK